MKTFRFLLPFALCAMAFMLLTAESCESKQGEQRRESIETRADAFARAENAHPVPHTENFPMRGTLVDYTVRTDLVNHPWYIYVLSDTGAHLYYHVAKSAPVNICAFLSSTEEQTSNGILTAPSLDGIYYGGGGGAGSPCNGWVFVDATTNAMRILIGTNLDVSDVPLKLSVPRVEVEVTQTAH